MRIVVLTSCTGEKSVEAAEGLRLEDFARGAAHVRAREKKIAESLRPAEELYTGQQHVRLMRGIAALRSAGISDLSLGLSILSAGYGIVPASRDLAPYEATFHGMGKAQLRAWADQLGVPDSFRAVFAEPYDLGLVLLGNDYLEACAMDGSVHLGGPTLLFCGRTTLRRLPKLGNLHAIPLNNAEAKRFSCGLVALKGEIAARILSQIAGEPSFVSTLPAATDVLDLLHEDAGPSKTKRSAARAKHDVDYVIALPSAWKNKPHRQKLRYFIPEWDDLVDRDYDFAKDEHSGGTGDWTNQVYAHQLYPEPNYDGILVSKVVAEKSKKKAERIDRLGVHRFLRVPRDFPVMGDCGAFGYIDQPVPPYRTDEILEYYTRLDFDYGVSIDHLIVTSTESERRARYDLTIENAAEFIRRHRREKLQWTPIGAVQGWDPSSYAAAARKYLAMGYEFIALGGLVRSSTKEVLRVLEAVAPYVRGRARMHLFGLARLDATDRFAKLGVTSIDSASALRRAWLGPRNNYYAANGNYCAIRIPAIGASFRAKQAAEKAGFDVERAITLERRALDTVRAYDRREESLETALNAVLQYEHLIGEELRHTASDVRRTLADRPWERCTCAVCRRWGVEVAIFRGNNRNRRRGFHNTYVFYDLLQQTLTGATTRNDELRVRSSQLRLI